MANDSAISLQTIDVLLYSTWRDANGLCQNLSCYSWVVFYELENSVNGLLFFFLTTFLTTLLINVFCIITITNTDAFYANHIELRSR